jgi:hypothetical protein
MITRLAFLYVQLSFVTSISSMNVKETNSSPLPIWVSVAAFLVVSTYTLGVLFLWGWKQTSRWFASGLWFGWRLTDRSLRYTSGVLWSGPGVSNVPISLLVQSRDIRRWRRSSFRVLFLSLLFRRHNSSQHVEHNIVLVRSIFRLRKTQLLVG